MQLYSNLKKKKCILDVDEMSVRVINKEESEGDIELYHEKQGQNYLAEERWRVSLANNKHFSEKWGNAVVLYCPGT